jgi:hypothetical protein
MILQLVATPVHFKGKGFAKRDRGRGGQNPKA